MKTIRPPLALLCFFLLPFAGCAYGDGWEEPAYYDTGYVETPLQAEVELFHARIGDVVLEDTMEQVLVDGRLYGTSTAFSIAATDVDMPLPEEPGMPIDPIYFPENEVVYIDLCPIDDVMQNGLEQSTAFVNVTVCTEYACAFAEPADLQIDVVDTLRGRVVDVHATWDDGSELDTRLRYTNPI